MLFRKKIERSCIYCMYSTKMDQDHLLCTKRGVVSMEGSCRKFEYDPFKRVPPRPKALDFSKFEEEDFSL